MSTRVHRLRPFEADRLRAATLTYAPVGGTRPGAPDGLPPGYHRLETVSEVGRGDEAFKHAAETLMTWRMHAGAGLRVAASGDRVEEGAVVRCRLGPLPVPCRVVWVVEEPRRRGFGYGTLPGHPEAGEEAFLVEQHADDRVTLSVTAYSRPGRLLTRLAGPLGRWGRRLVVARYAAALRR